MKISFLITFYNQREYVKDSIESILKIEKPCDWEILIGDDGSVDGTIEEIQQYIELYPDHIQLFVMPRDVKNEYESVKRASANRLNILEHASCDLFCTLDGDDYYIDTEFVKESIEVFKEDPNISVVAFGYKRIIDGCGGKEIILPVEVGCGRIDKKNYLESFYLPAGACVHKICWGKERIDYIKKIGYFDDNDILINSLNYGEMYSARRAIYGYRQTKTSVYSRMSSIEQAVLNVQGLDVDLNLMSASYEDSLMIRYSQSILNMYFNKRNIIETIGNKKYIQYSENSKKISGSICYSILNYYNLNLKEKRAINDIIIKIIIKRKKMAIGMVLQSLVEFVKIFLESKSSKR